MIVTVLAPEILLAKNAGDLLAVNVDLETLQDWAAQDGVPWTRTHSLFANMGGFAIRRSSPERAAPTTFPETGTDLQEPTPRTRQKADWKSNLRRRLTWKSKSNVAVAPPDSHEQIPTKNKEPTTTELGLSTDESSQPVLIHLLAQDIVQLRSKGLLPRLPYITLEEINDKSKSDSLVRAIAVVQIMWMVLQIIVRAFRSLAISQLEIAVLAFAACAIILYSINWEKPKDVQVPVTIISYSGLFPEDTMKIVLSDRNTSRSVYGTIVIALELLFSLLTTTKERSEKWPLGKPIPNTYNRDVRWSERTRSMVGFASGSDAAGLFLGTTIFGAVHIAAWNFVFPTRVESLLWKIASILCTMMGFAFGVMLVVITFCSTRLKAWAKALLEMFFGSLFITTPLIYVVCRVFLVVEIFRSLCFLPPSAYIATWATNVPHIA
jgi:hypothetical protein